MAHFQSTRQGKILQAARQVASPDHTPMCRIGNTLFGGDAQPNKATGSGNVDNTEYVVGNSLEASRRVCVCVQLEGRGKGKRGDQIRA